MGYSDKIDRSDIGALIPEEVSNSLLKNLPNQSVALSLFTRTTMSRNQVRMPVLSVLPVAYWVNGDTGLKQTSEAQWANKYLNAEELAVIVPIPEAVLDDAAFDVFGNIQPLLESAIARKIDQAVLFGTEKPASWPAAIVPGATAAGHTYTRGTNNASAGGLGADLSNLFGLVETDGYDVTGIVANTKLKPVLRNARKSDGERLMEVDDRQAYGVTIAYPARGLWPTGSGSAEMIAGDFREGILAVRQDFSYKVLSEAAIFNDQGQLIFNLPQQDMVALRVTFRCAFQIANTITYDQPDGAQRYPFAVLLAP